MQHDDVNHALCASLQEGRDSRFEKNKEAWIPTFVGMTEYLLTTLSGAFR